jgi:hypothetical protein
VENAKKVITEYTRYVTVPSQFEEPELDDQLQFI